MVDIQHIKALKDNYIWCCIHNNHCVVVDPGDAERVEQFITKQHLTLDAILVTHHHHDHTDGVQPLKEKYQCQVIATDHPSLQAVSDRVVQEGDRISLLEDTLVLNVMATPGHTLDHVIYYNDEILFTGDTLFHMGCGRVLEGTQKMLFDSLRKIAKLNPEAKMYCGHEYTLDNVAFARHISHKGSIYETMYRMMQDKYKLYGSTVPTLLKEQLVLNPFYFKKASNSTKALAKGKVLTTEFQIFRFLRTLKDGFS